METGETVSIVLPTYNRCYCIERSIDSILRQTYADFELLVIDDASTDDTETLVKKIAETDTRVRYFRQPQNKGVSAARNEGIRRTKGSCIAFQDSDDVWRADKLEKQMRVLKEQPECGLVYCMFEGRKKDGTLVHIPDDSIEKSVLQGDMYRLLLQGNVIDAPTVIVRRECLAQSGLFDEELICLEDWELFLRIAKDRKIGYVDEPLLLSDIHEGGVSSRVGGYFQARCKMILLHRKALVEYGLFDGVVRQLLTTAKQAGVLEQVSQMLERALTGI